MTTMKQPPTETMLVATAILKEYDTAKHAHQVRLEAIERDRAELWLVEYGSTEVNNSDVRNIGGLSIKGTDADGKEYYLSTERMHELALEEAGPPPDLRAIVQAYADGRADRKRVKKPKAPKQTYGFKN